MVRKLNIDWIAIIGLFLLSRVIWLKRLAIFNDEAIYLDWGYRAVTQPQMLFYSLFDGKQPLEIWLFGLAQKIVPDSLVAGRLVAVFFGLLTLIGLVFLARRCTKSRHAVWLTALAYICAPWFVFYDRQALMESAVAATTVWIVYTTIRLTNKPSIRLAILYGSISGLGLWIKSSAVLAIGAGLFSLLLTTTVKDWRQQVWQKLQLILAGVATAVLILLPLITQPKAIQILARNDRFSLSTTELLSFPWQHWTNNMLATAQMIWWYYTPILAIVFASAVIVLLTQWKKISRPIRLVTLITLMMIGGFILTVRTPSTRYLVSLSVLLPLITGIGLSWAIEQRRLLGSVVVAASLLFATWQSWLLLSDPIRYLAQSVKATRFNDYDAYVENWTAGWAVTEANTFLLNKLEETEEEALVTVRLDAGNPESSTLNAFKDSRFTAMYISDVPLQIDQDEKCLRFAYPTYFVVRDRQLANTNSWWEEIERFDNPNGHTSVGVYRNAAGCLPELPKNL